MKKLLYLPLLAGALSLNACKDSDFEIESQIPEKFHKVLYLDITGKQSLTLYNTEEDNVYPITLIKGGSKLDATAMADIVVRSQEEIDNDYSKLEGVNYKVVGSDCYSFDLPHIEFGTEDSYKKITISIDAQEVEACMEADPTAHWVLPIDIVSETDSINANKNSLFLQFTEVVTPSMGFTSNSVNVKEYTYGEVSTIEQAITFGLNTSNKWDIDCQFGINEAYIDAYNEQNGTLFQVIPTTAASFPETLTLPAGTTTMDYSVSVQSDLLLPGDYMLPIQIGGVSMFNISESYNTYPFAIRIMGQELKKTNWTAEANTEELVGESAPNGPVEACIDGNTSTFWHSQWQGGSHSLPHEIIIDTHEENTITQFGLVRRENNNYVKSGEFYVSADNKEWTKVGSFNMKNDNAKQVFSVTPTKGRYLKVLITQSTSGSNSCMAEIYAYGIN